MPIKLTSAQYRTILIVILVAAVSLGIGVKYFWRAFPEAAIQFRVTRTDSEPLARSFLAGRGVRLGEYRHAAIFDFDDQAKVYLERTAGLERMNSLTQGPIHLWRWSHRWFKPQQKEEYRVDVTPAGQVVGFDHEIPEAAPGANLDQAQARQLAEKFLQEVMKRDASELEFVEAETEKRPARTDHSFTWKQKNVALGDGSYRIQVEVDGDQVAGYREFVKVPEQWNRDYERLRSRNEAAQIVDEVFWVLLTLTMIAILILRLRDQDVPIQMAVAFGLVGTALFFLGQLNNFSLTEFNYQTTDTYSSFLSNYLLRSVLAALGVGTWIFFLVASSEPVYRENYPRLLSFRRYLSWRGLRTRSFLMANVVGIGLTFFFFAYQTLFYLGANKLGAWAPADVNYSDLLNTRVPWVWVLFMGFMPAVTEEMQFRAFAIPFIRKLFRSGPLALVLAAFIWGFLHSAYPNQPFFIRGLEVGVGGIVVGLIMLRFGILATLIWHYSVDALYTAFLLLRSHNNYLMVSGAVTAGVMLVPLLVALVAYLRSGTFVEEDPLNNSSEGVSRPVREAATREPESPLIYQPLSIERMVAAGILTVVFAALAFIPVERFGEGIEIRVGREQALGQADAYLRQHNVYPNTYRRVAWLDEDLDPLSLRYLFERRTVSETDRIYKQATAPLLWEVRYFRPLEKEEHLVFVDPADGKVFAYRHLLDENAPGATLSSEQARALAEKAVVEHGYKLADFELQDIEAKKLKAREDYTLTWQAKSPDPRNVGEEHYRLVVEIAGDQVVSFTRLFKLPEAWVRQITATRLSKIILTTDMVLLTMGVVAGFLILFVQLLKSSRIEWRRSALVGGVITAVVILLEANAVPGLARQYPTSIPWQTFWLFVVIAFLVIALLLGAVGWLLVSVATSLYPEAWRLVRGSARRIWRRDAAMGLVLSLAAGAGLTRLGDWVVARFHAFAPVSIGLMPGSFDTAWPGAAIFLSALRSSLMYVCLAAVLIHLVLKGWARRAWWLGLGVLLLLAGLGPSDAHSLREYFIGWGMAFGVIVVGAALVGWVFRDNVLAYVMTLLCLPIAPRLVDLLSQPLGFYRWNGIGLALLTLAALVWMFSGAEPEPGAPPGGPSPQ